MAEIRTISGLQFEVEKLEDLGADGFRVIVRGEDRIVAGADLDEFVVKKYFSDEALSARYSVEDLERFTTASAKEGKAVLAGYALGFLLLHTSANEERKVIFLGEISKEKDGQEIFKRALLNMQDGLLAPSRSGLGGGPVALLYFIALADPDWMRVSATRLLYRYQAEIRDYVQSVFRKAVGENSEKGMDESVEVIAKLYGDEDSVYRDLNLLREKVRRVSAAIEGRDVEVLFPLIEAKDSDVYTDRVLTPLLVRALHVLAQDALSAKKFEQALATLARVPLEKRTDFTHELVRSALRELKPKHPSVLGLKPVREFLKSIAGKDASIKEALARFLAAQIRLLCASFFVVESEEYFALLLAQQPDPNSENDALRMEQAIAYARINEHARAAAKRAQIRGDVSALSRARLSAARLTFKEDRLVVFGYWLVLLAAVPYLFKIARAIAHNPWLERQISNDDEQVQPGFNFALFGRGLDPKVYEYRDHLRVLGVAENADIKTIKAAYRNAVKDVHPDVNRDNDPAAAERFISLTTSYEKLLDLRRELGMPD